jgi:hypothetical protein
LRIGSTTRGVIFDCAAMASNFSHSDGPDGPGQKNGSFRADVPGMPLRIPPARAATERGAMLIIALHIGREMDCGRIGVRAADFAVAHNEVFALLMW